MTPPRGMIGIAVLFWGWQTGFLAVAVAMAAVIEARPLVGVRWDLRRSDFNRVSVAEVDRLAAGDASGRVQR